MVKEFLDYISLNDLFRPEDKILLAVSGGVDSVVLASLFREAGLSFAIAHCNFQLRSEESDGDERFVQNLAESFKAPCFIHHFDTKNYAAKHGVSTQMAARDLRYGWFEQLCAENNYKFIATAHHLDDSFETAIFNMAKGTGISGLRGILPLNRRIVRPMLFASKEKILQYAKNQGLSWREDSSNESVKYSRNLIRHEVMPQLRKINPSLTDTFLHTQARLRSTERLLLDSLERFKTTHFQFREDDIYIDKTAVDQVELVVLEECLKPFGFNFIQTIELKQVLNDGVGKVFVSDTHQVNIDRDFVIISETVFTITGQSIQSGDQLAVNEVMRIQLEIVEDVSNILKRRDAASVDFDKLTFPIKLRKWQLGDHFRPLGMKGKKKLSDFMIDEKIPLNLKERVCVIESCGEVVWVVGHRVDDRFKVDAGTKRLYNMVIERHD